jgi:hypothetical protein
MKKSWISQGFSLSVTGGQTTATWVAPGRGRVVGLAISVGIQTSSTDSVNATVSQASGAGYAAQRNDWLAAIILTSTTFSAAAQVSSAQTQYFPTNYRVEPNTSLVLYLSCAVGTGSGFFVVQFEPA